MRVVMGNVEHAMDFYRATSSAQFLLFFIGGDLRDNRELEKLMQHAHTLNMVSGERVDIYLFVDGQRGVIESNPRGGERILIPGGIIDPESGSVQESHQRYVSNLEQFNFDKELQKNLIEGTITAGSDVAQYFGVAAENMPCLVLSNGYVEESCTIPLSGADTVTALFSLIKELAAVQLPNRSRISNPTAIRAKTSKFGSIRSEMRNTVANIEAGYQGLVERIDDPNLVIQLGYLNDFIPKIADPEAPLAAEERENLLAFLTKISEQIPTFGKKILKLRSQISAVEHHKQRMQKINTAESELNEISKITADYQTCQEAIEAIAERHAKGLAWRGRIANLKRSLASIMGVTKGVQEVTSTKEAIEKLVGG